ncbi:dachshund a isoform X3 [Sinocyclocheilus rhinocerous]|uniref:SKI/SNO/DAC domain-containing protein n=1 Tax=Sinocyclocheilus rhinocerous TaxID=307959 RepID=A0A673M7C4_9TELE|nr:PREDICTED: dachshund homolog 2 isoform X3 [Sinocyclocheilus rhinocerous]
MAVSATPPVLSPTSTPGGASSLFRPDSLYSSPAESPRLTSSMINSFITGTGGGGGSTNGNGPGGVHNNECKMVEVHGVKVASFAVDGQELICLPQVFDMFLKHLVGGLHTVYTKLKRLDICPVVCTVEQVRILRGLGAIQPGVNRCKLITRKDFEALYNDCTNASSRPGRPPKRSLGMAMQDSSRLLPHSVHGLLSPSLLSPTGLTAAAMAEAMKLQKMKLMAMNNIHGAGSQNGTESENEELNSSAGGSESSWDKEKLQSPPSSRAQHGLAHAVLAAQHGLSGSHLSSLQQSHLLANRLDLPFMMMPHPLLPVSLPPASVAMAMNQMNHLNTIANMAAAAQMHSPLSRAGASVIKECVQDSPSPAPSLEETPRPGSQPSSHPSSSVSSSPNPHTQSHERLVLNPTDGELPERDTGINMKKILKEKDEAQLALPIQKPGFEKLPLGTQTLPPGFPAPFLFADGLSSVETLLTNIQGLLKVAVDNARVQDKQVQQERKELKMELYREREMRESLERQLTSELHSRATIQKRLKKEKKSKRKLQEALEFESKRREQVEQALKQATSPESLRMSLNEAVIPEVKSEHNGSQQENSAVQGNNLLYVNYMCNYKTRNKDLTSYVWSIVCI